MKSVASFVGGAASVGLIVVLAGVPGMGKESPYGPESAYRLPRDPHDDAQATIEERSSFSYEPIVLAEEPVQPIPVDVESAFTAQGHEYVAARVELGRALFHDPRLSNDGALSCASCHDLRYAGVDRAITATGTDGSLGVVNTPTVYNVGFHRAHFWDGRAADLEEQARGGPNPEGSMAIDWERASARLSSDGELMEQLRAAYPEHDVDSGPAADLWIRALGDFERSLTTPNAPFDRYLRGETDAISEAAKEGYQLFKDVGCAGCHDGPAVGGTRLEVLGTAHAYYDRNATDADLGRFNVTGSSEDRHRFKVPSLRNVALTGPYLHDGSIDGLEEIVRTMAHHQLDRHLSAGELTRLVAFLESLTGEHEGRPLGAVQNTAAHPAAR